MKKIQIKKQSRKSKKLLKMIMNIHLQSTVSQGKKEVKMKGKDKDKLELIMCLANN